LGWYRNYTPEIPAVPPATEPTPESFDHEFVFSTTSSATKVYNDLSLYPKWAEVSEGDLKVTVSFSLSAAEETFTLNPSSLSFSKATLLAATAHSVSVTLSNGDSFSAVDWSWNNGAITWTGNTMTIDFDDATYEPLLVSGPQIIDLEVTSGGKGYNTHLTLTISP
jgi:hypothetical protein